MKLRFILFWGVVLVLMAQSGCDVVPTAPDEKTTQVPTNVRGTVLRSDNLAPLAGAIVYDVGGLARDTSGVNGNFVLKYTLSSRLVSKVIASRTGFGNDTVNIALDPGRDTTITLRLRADSTSPITGGVVSRAASIVLVGITNDNIAIRGSGLNETSFLTFEVRDSSGQPVGVANRAIVNFTILGGPGGGEYVFPVSQETNVLTGRVTTRISSGTRAGILQVYATTTVGTAVIRSSPVRLTISGGLPVQERFTISREKANIAGGVISGLRTKISVLAGDREGNPVVPNTAIYFTTTGGIIQPFAQTDRDGEATVELITGNPLPPNGRAIVTARTVGDSGITVSRSVQVVFSGRTQIIGPTAPFTILDNGTYSFTYRVQDAKGNPLVGGTTIAVTASGPGAGDLQLSGDHNVTLPDTDDPSFTNFAVTVTDTREGGAAGPVTITIRVTSENGNASYNFSGEVRGQQGIIQPPPSTRQPAQIAFIGVTSSDIFVSGVGALENSVITYEVRDSLGTPLDQTRKAYATYSLNFFPHTSVPGGTAPRLIPSADSTDNAGRLRVNITSGTRSGVAQVVVRINTPNGVITSQPVRIGVNSGFPDQRRFSIYATNYNFPGLQRFNQRLNVTVQIADKYSNPVQAGTVVYFSTTHGSIQTQGSVTGTDGFVTKQLISGRPTPEGSDVLPGLGPGYAYVKAQTLGENGTFVADSILVLWTGEPIITKLDTITTFSVPNGGGVGPFKFRVADLYGHPMSPGTSISVTAEGALVTGDALVVMRDTFSSGPGTTDFVVAVVDTNPTDTDPPKPTILKVTVTHAVYGTYTLVLATGTVD